MNKLNSKSYPKEIKLDGEVTRKLAHEVIVNSSDVITAEKGLTSRYYVCPICEYRERIEFEITMKGPPEYKYPKCRIEIKREVCAPRFY